MKKQRVLVLVHETLVPPETLEGYSEQEIEEWHTEYDVCTTLRGMGHDVKVLGLGDNIAELRATITDWKPDIAFNLLEEFQGIVTYETVDLMSMAVTDGDITAKKAFDLMVLMTDEGRALRLPRSPAELGR